MVKVILYYFLLFYSILFIYFLKFKWTITSNTKRRTNEFGRHKSKVFYKMKSTKNLLSISDEFFVEKEILKSLPVDKLRNSFLSSPPQTNPKISAVFPRPVKKALFPQTEGIEPLERLIGFRSTPRGPPPSPQPKSIIFPDRRSNCRRRRKPSALSSNKPPFPFFYSQGARNFRYALSFEPRYFLYIYCIHAYQRFLSRSYIYIYIYIYIDTHPTHSGAAKSRTLFAVRPCLRIYARGNAWGYFSCIDRREGGEEKKVC